MLTKVFEGNQMRRMATIFFKDFIVWIYTMIDHWNYMLRHSSNELVLLSPTEQTFSNILFKQISWKTLIYINLLHPFHCQFPQHPLLPEWWCCNHLSHSSLIQSIPCDKIYALLDSTWLFVGLGYSHQMTHQWVSANRWVSARKT